jgi:succinate dehydrogenase / fumarate reductase, membrane anchor subunit
MSMLTPLKNVRGLGSAKSGTDHFWHQRLTALANLPLMIFFVWFIVAHLGSDRSAIVTSLKNPLIAIAMLLTLASVFWHMRLGMQVVIEDYVTSHSKKFLALILNSAFVAVMFALAAYSILKMSFAI